MSTKTTFKRVALVTVAALSFGVLTSVAPATAADSIDPVTNVTASAGAGAQTVNTAASIATLTIAGTTASTGNDDIDVTVAGPAGATMIVTAVGAADITDDTITIANSGTVDSEINDAGAAFIDAVDSAITAKFSMPGVYTVTLSDDTDPVTVRVLPSSSLTSSVSASAGAATYAVGASPVINVVRNVGGVLADGTILLQVVTTPDASITVGQILGETTEAAVTAAALDTNGRAFTFPTATFDTAGTYEFTAFVDINANNVKDASEPSAAASFTLGAAAATTSKISATLSRTVGSSTSGFADVTVTATITDADGYPSTATVYAAETTSLGAAVTANSNNGYTNVSNAISTSGSPLTRIGTTNTYTGTFAINVAYTTTDYIDTYITVYTAEIAADATTSAKKALRIANDTALMTTTAGAKAIVLNQSTTDTPVGTVSSGVRQTLTGEIASAAAAITATVDKTYVSHVYTINGASGQEGEYLRVSVAPAAATSNAVVAPTSYLVAMGADLTASITVTATAPAAADGYVLTVADGTNSVTSTITFATAAPTWTVSPSANIKAKYADKSAVTGTLTDQFGRVLASKAVSVTVTGRNAGTYLGTTDAAGAFKFEWTDASTSTVVLTDSLVFNYVYTASSTSTTTSTASSSARTVTYSATGIEVGSITVTAPSDTTERAIDQIQGSSGAAATSRVNFTATVKTAAGAPVGAGLLVTFAGSSADLFYGGVTTAVTDEFGQATVSVFRKLTGTTEITATAGGLTATAAGIKWSNKLIETAAPNTAAVSADYHARYVTLTADNAKAVSEGIIRFTAKVTDRFGNAVDGVDVLFSETGAGRFYNAPATTTTNSAGEVSIDLNSQAGETGAVSVTVTISDANARQINDIAGFMTYTTATTTANAAAVTAVSGLTAAVKSATATATIEKSTATSTADALLALAQALGTKDQATAAVDAAAEATDAANAATDAANAAAEAADAATAAAQDAADAVAALSTQVSEMVAALKKQITSLTNLVIKIQKKVKA